MSDIRPPVEKQIEIDATPEEVWEALVDAEKLTTWFSIEARVEGGVGGVITLGWGEGMEGTSKIQIWKPGEHLQCLDQLPAPPESQNAPSRKATTLDYFLSSERGKTVLRLVHSGFSADAVWDKEYDSIGRGWPVFLANLKHIFEVCRERGQSLDRQAAWKLAQQTGVSKIVERSPQECWERLLGTKGLGLRGAAPALAKGARAAGNMVVGGAWDGVIDFLHSPVLLGVKLDDGGLLRLFCEGDGGSTWVTVTRHVFDREGLSHAQLSAMVNEALA